MSRNLSPTSAGMAETGAPALQPRTDTKGTINLRIDSRTKQLIDSAAAALGKTRTEFMMDAARREAIEVLLERRLFALEAPQYDAFLDVLDNPPPPGPRLQSLLRRKPAWEK